MTSGKYPPHLQLSVHPIDNQKARFRHRSPDHRNDWLAEFGQVVPHPRHLRSPPSESARGCMHEVGILTLAIYPY